MKRAAIYARVSTPHQAEERTIESQLHALQAYAQEQGFYLQEKHIYRDEGQSGSQLDRPALDRLRDDAAAGLIDVVLVLSPDRLARRYAYQVLLVEELERWGCEVIFLERPIGEKAEDRLLLEIQGAFAEYERAKLVDRSRRGKLQKARMGQVMNVRAPYGYHYVPKCDGVPPAVVVEESEAEVVRQIFRWFTEGWSIYGITRALTQRKIPTKFERSAWSKASIYRILKNPAYLGTLFFNCTGYVAPETATGRLRRVRRPKEEWIAVAIPAVVEGELFEQAQRRFQQNQQFAKRNNKRREYLLRGLVRCGVCARKMTGLVAAHEYAYYRCQGKNPAVAGQSPCPSRMVRAERLDCVVWEAVVTLLQRPELVREYFPKVQQLRLEGRDPLGERIRSLEQLISRNQEQVQRLIDAYAAGVIELSELAERRQRLEERLLCLRQERAELAEQQRQQIREQDVLQSLATFRRAVGKGLEGLTFAERQQLVRLLVEEVEVKGSEVQIQHIIPVGRIIDLHLASTHFWFKRAIVIVFRTRRLR